MAVMVHLYDNAMRLYGYEGPYFFSMLTPHSALTALSSWTGMLTGAAEVTRYYIKDLRDHCEIMAIRVHLIISDHYETMAIRAHLQKI